MAPQTRTLYLSLCLLSCESLFLSTPWKTPTAAFVKPVLQVLYDQHHLYDSLLDGRGGHSHSSSRTFCFHSVNTFLLLHATHHSKPLVPQTDSPNQPRSQTNPQEAQRQPCLTKPGPGKVSLPVLYSWHLSTEENTGSVAGICGFPPPMCSLTGLSAPSHLAVFSPLGLPGNQC